MNQTTNQPKPTKSEIIQTALLEGANLSCDPEIGKRIQTAKQFLRQIKESKYEFSTTELTTFYQYIKSGNVIDIIIPTCPDYVVDDSINSFDDNIIDAGIPSTLSPILDNTQTFIDELLELQIPHKISVIISNPRYAGVDLLSLESQAEKAIEAISLSSEKIAKLLKEKFPTSDIEATDFMQKFKHDTVTTLEAKYLNTITNSLDKEALIRFISAKNAIDKSKNMIDYNRAVRVKSIPENLSAEDYCTNKVIRGVVELLALGDLVASTFEQPIFCGPVKRIPLNERNNPMYKLVEYGKIEQRTTPIIANTV